MTYTITNLKTLVQTGPGFCGQLVSGVLSPINHRGLYRVRKRRVVGKIYGMK